MVRPTSASSAGDVLSRREDIDSKLQKELSGLNLLKDTLQKSNQLAKGMTSILTSFEDRLAKLEETILPVYNNTSSLQRKQENIDKTLTALEHVISYYNVSNEVDQTIRDGPVNSLDDYMESLACVRRAIAYFEKNNPESQELQTLNMLFDVGGKALEKEFRILLNRYCKPTQPILIMDMLGMKDDELCVEDDKAAMELLPEKAAKELTCIAKWLVGQNREDYMNVYATIRSNILLRSLQGFKDFLKSSSGGAVALGGGTPAVAHGSPAPIRSWYKDTPTRKTAKKMQQALLKKSTQPDIKYSQNIEPPAVLSHGHRRQGSFFEIRDENFDDVYKYLKSFSALYKLMQCEIQLMSNIILRQHWKAIFERIYPASLDMIIQEGDTFASRAKRCADKHDFAGSLIVFPILKHLITSKPEFRFILEESHATICSKLDSLIATFHVTGTRILEDFIDNIKNDQDRQMPKDGTVHEMTSNAVIFLEQLKDYAETVGSMLIEDQNYTRDRSKSMSAVAYYIFRVLSVLGLTLNNKSDTYSDPYLRIIFRLNNLQYILKSLQRTGVLAIAKIHNSDLEIHYQDQILDMKRVYSQSWSRVLHYVTEVDRPLPTALSASSKLKDKDRQSIKDKFTGFNKEIEDICKVQKGYAIPDTELRESLKRENKDFILPKYESFYNKYLNMNFTKHKEKYIKYTPIAVSSMMEKFFDVAA